MDIPLSTRVRALFARDKDTFWWRHFTDEELALRRMDVWELAAVIEEASVRAGMERKRIVADHLLNVRLAQIQATASWGSGVLGFVGAIIGAALSVALTSAFQDKNPQSPARTPVTATSAMPPAPVPTSAVSTATSLSSSPAVVAASAASASRR